VTGFLTPTSLWLADLASGALAITKTLPAKFRRQPSHGRAVRGHVQRWNQGSVLRRPSHRDEAGRSTPTILNAYGGFLVSETPSYSAEIGKLWLERGGAYVLANIRAEASSVLRGTRPD